MGSGEQCEEEGISERKCYELTAAPILHPSCTFRSGGDNGVGSEKEKEPEKNRVGRGGRKVVLVCFSLSYSIFNWQ